MDIGRSLWLASDGREASWKNSTIAVRSNRDRGAIEPRSGSLREAIVSKRSENDRRLTRTSIEARSWPDRGPIVGLLEAKIADILKRNRSKIEADSKPIRNLRLHVMKPPPRRMDSAPWPPLQPTNSDQFPSLKTHVLLLCSSTFDRLVKKLCEFRGISLVHRVPPAFRLDCEAIGAGLITNFSLISSNFPIEFRTSTRKNPSKFASIHENWSPILAAIGLVVRFDRLSGGNLSFYSI